jgi:hypothetical protein
MYHGLVWIDAKKIPTNILVMTTTLVFVWMVANYLACQWLFGQCCSGHVWFVHKIALSKFWLANILVELFLAHKLANIG